MKSNFRKKIFPFLILGLFLLLSTSAFAQVWGGIWEPLSMILSPDGRYYPLTIYAVFIGLLSYVGKFIGSQTSDIPDEFASGVFGVFALAGILLLDFQTIVQILVIGLVFAVSATIFFIYVLSRSAYEDHPFFRVFTLLAMGAGVLWMVGTGAFHENVLPNVSWAQQAGQAIGGISIMAGVWELIKVIVWGGVAGGVIKGVGAAGPIQGAFGKVRNKVFRDEEEQEEKVVDLMKELNDLTNATVDNNNHPWAYYKKVKEKIYEDYNDVTKVVKKIITGRDTFVQDRTKRWVNAIMGKVIGLLERDIRKYEGEIRGMSDSDWQTFGDPWGEKFINKAESYLRSKRPLSDPTKETRIMGFAHNLFIM